MHIIFDDLNPDKLIKKYRSTQKYDLDGNIFEYKEYYTDGSFNMVTYKYNAQNNLIEKIEYVGKNDEPLFPLKRIEYIYSK